jgi:hypothetical protein
MAESKMIALSDDDKIHVYKQVMHQLEPISSQPKKD